MAMRYIISGKTYYVYSQFVATLIDYGLSEVWIPVDNISKRFGPTNIDKMANGKPISHIRDLSKLIGFIAWWIPNNGISAYLKIILSKLYIEAVRPDLTNLSDIQKVEKVMEDKKHLFVPNEKQAKMVELGQIDFDSFINIFKRVVPSSEIEEFFTEGDPIYPVLGCSEECLDTCSTFFNIMISDPNGQAEIASQDPKNLMKHGLDRSNALRRFRDEEEYKLVIQDQILQATKKVRSNDVISVNNSIGTRINIVEAWIKNPQIPDASKFKFQYGKDIETGYRIYLKFITIWFQRIANLNEAIILNNGLTSLRQKAEHKARLIQISLQMTKILNKQIITLKNNLINLSRDGIFGKLFPRFSARIINQIPNKLIFDAVE